jgi:hypothetical protein
MEMLMLGALYRIEFAVTSHRMQARLLLLRVLVFLK